MRVSPTHLLFGLLCWTARGLQPGLPVSRGGRTNTARGARWLHPVPNTHTHARPLLGRRAGSLCAPAKVDGGGDEANRDAEQVTPSLAVVLGPDPNPSPNQPNPNPTLLDLDLGLDPNPTLTRSCNLRPRPGPHYHLHVVGLYCTPPPPSPNRMPVRALCAGVGSLPAPEYCQGINRVGSGRVGWVWVPCPLPSTDKVLIE